MSKKTQKISFDMPAGCAPPVVGEEYRGGVIVAVSVGLAEWAEDGEAYSPVVITVEYEGEEEEEEEEEEA